MDVLTNGRSRLGFGLFEADLSARELYRRGALVHVQEQPFQVLAMLLARPGELVTREELRKKLWPGDTFVDFDEGVNTAIKKLRYALGDSSENPRFIETLPRRGYRFIATLRALGGSPLTDSNPDATAEIANRFRNDFRAESAMHFSIVVPSGLRDLALSRDGRMLAFIAPVPEHCGTHLWVQEVGAAGALCFENTEGASYPFWSPDSRSIAFFAEGKLKRVAADGGPVQVICDAPIGRGGTWNESGVIVFAPLNGSAICRVCSGGGSVELLPGFEHTLTNTQCNRWPLFLPDGKHFLYTSVDFSSDQRSDGNAIYLAALDSPERRRLVTSSSNAAYVRPGYLVFFRNGTLQAQAFDAQQLQPAGEAFAVTNDVEYFSSIARVLFSASESGTLVYQRSSGAAFSRLQWFHRDGRPGSTVGAPLRYASPKLSPDGNRIAVEVDDPLSFNTDIWTFDLHQGIGSRFTFGSGQDQAPLWSHRGDRLLWLSLVDGTSRFHIKRISSLWAENALSVVNARQLSFAASLSDWSPDSRILLYTDLGEENVLHLHVLPIAGDGKGYRLLSGHSADVQGQFSPDGRWVAYCTNESGGWQVCVTSFPGREGKCQISTHGGQQPRWRRDGKELFFLSRDRKVMSVSVNANSTFDFSTPTALFQTHAHEAIGAEEFFTYDVSADGQRFLINAEIKQNNPSPVDIILKWSSKLKK